MSNIDEIRWMQRLQNFKKALDQLESACDQEEYTDLERAGLVQMFEFTSELAWNTYKDLLFYEGYDVKSPRAAIRTAHEMGYLSEDDAEMCLQALQKRNIMSHTYDEATAEEAEELITQRYAPLFRRIYDGLEGKAKS